MKRILTILLLLPFFAYAQNTTTVIPGYLRVVKVPHNIALNDSVAVLDVNNNLKKAVMPGGGGSAVGINGLNGTTNIGLGGTLSQNTTENLSGFTLNINQTTGNILNFKRSATTVSSIDNDGGLAADNIRAFSNTLDALLTMRSSSGFQMSRSRADSVSVLTVTNNDPNSSGAIFLANNAWGGTLRLNQNGMSRFIPGVTSASGTGVGSYHVGYIIPSANNDTLIGSRYAPNFGTKVITGLGSLVGGSGYPTGTFLAVLSGGTGAQSGSGGQCVIYATASGGAITSFSIVKAGVNFTVGDVLSIIPIIPNGGSGATLTVVSVNTYTGLFDISSEFDLAPIRFGSITTPTNLLNGMMWYNGSHFYGYASGATEQIDHQVISGSYSTTASSTTTFTVTIGVTQANNTYKVQVTPTSAIAAGSGYYVTNKTTTTFQVVYPAGLTGAVSLDWSVLK